MIQGNYSSVEIHPHQNVWKQDVIIYPNNLTIFQWVYVASNNIKINENVELFVMDYVFIQNWCLFLKHPLNNEATKETTHDIFKP